MKRILRVSCDWNRLFRLTYSASFLWNEHIRHSQVQACEEEGKRGRDRENFFRELSFIFQFPQHGLRPTNQHSFKKVERVPNIPIWKYGRFISALHNQSLSLLHNTKTMNSTSFFSLSMLRGEWKAENRISFLSFFCSCWLFLRPNPILPSNRGSVQNQNRGRCHFGSRAGKNIKRPGENSSQALVFSQICCSRGPRYYLHWDTQVPRNCRHRRGKRELCFSRWKVRFRANSDCASTCDLWLSLPSPFLCLCWVLSFRLCGGNAGKGRRIECDFEWLMEGEREREREPDWKQDFTEWISAPIPATFYFHMLRVSWDELGRLNAKMGKVDLGRNRESTGGRNLTCNTLSVWELPDPISPRFLVKNFLLLLLRSKIDHNSCLFS